MPVQGTAHPLACPATVFGSSCSPRSPQAALIPAFSLMFPAVCPAHRGVTRSYLPEVFALFVLSPLLVRYFREAEWKSTALHGVSTGSVKLLLKAFTVWALSSAQLSQRVSWFLLATCLGSEHPHQVNVSRRLGESFRQSGILLLKCYFENISG